MSTSAKRLLTTALTVIFVLLPVVAIWQRQAIFDWSRLRNYTPSAQIQQLAANTTMTDEAKHLFYVYHAELQDKEAFNTSCEFGEQSIVLGCYVSGQGIYVYNVTDPRLSGIQEVTAGHEVLHAAYDRLPANERQRIDNLLNQTFDKLDNQRIKEAIQAYKDRDPSIVQNELHSILGTEVRTLPEELEAYYKRYFSDRSKVVSYSEHYEQAFTEQKQKAAVIESQINQLKQQIETLDARLRVTKQQLSSDYAALQADRANADPEPYNARVRAYNADVQSYNAQVRESYRLIDQHNALVAQYNQAISEEKELIQAIDSRPDTLESH